MEKDVKSLLSIKVLRLVKPAMIGPLPLTCDSRDLVSDLWERELRMDVTATPGIENLSLGQFLRLPQGFGNMYLGETFTCYVVIQNESPVGVTNVSVRNRTMSLMKTGDTIDLIMNHEIKEMGKHMLICTLTYSVPSSAPTSEPIFVERFFKFQVKKPLDVKTKLYNAEPLCLEKVDLEPSSGFNCISMNGTSEKDLLIRTRMDIQQSTNFKQKWPNLLLDVEGSQQFLYRLIPKADNARTMTNIGKLDIVWKTSMGSHGRLQTSQLQRQITVLNDLRLIVEKVPDTSLVDKPFDTQCRIVNTTSDRDMDLRLELDPAIEGYIWVGVTKTNLGILAPTNQLNLTVSIFPFRTGLINVSGIRLVDLNRGEKFCFNDLTQVLVLQK
ncbi:Trafficking protein particle complex subunit 13 [Folsomia candida]|uniref:Trafficking protein particle complex subunit 13 n=1 Tax=Folsomia candida TaxID=158441 RepID=A0A226DZJ4_FOLCA|nr:Trafficking protein particle complex subunit 13 [Folsomia candida]